MFTGLSIGIAAAFVWSITNLVDKYLVDEYSSNGNVGGVLLLSCFFPITLLILAFLVTEGMVLGIPFREVMILLASGFLMVAWIYFYLKALAIDDASVVMTLLVLAPLFSLLFGFLILEEAPTSIQLVAGSLMVSGALVVSYERKTGNFKWLLLGYATAASVVTGLMHSLFKFAAIDAGAWESLFWRSGGMVIMAVLIYFFIQSYRDSFHLFIRKHFSKGVGLNLTNESLTLAGDTLFAIAILFAPLVLVQTTEAYQPIFIFLMVLIINKLGIRSITENIERQTVVQKSIGFVLVLCGTIILAVV